MLIVTRCKECGEEYCYDPNWEPQYREMCQSCAACMNSIDMDEWADYYTNPENIRKIAEHCKYREVIIIRKVEDRKITVRPIKIFKPEHLKFWIDRLDLRKTLFDLYISNASVKLPKLTSNLSKMKEDREYLNEHWEELLTGYDIFVDVDVEKPEHRMYARKWAGEIVKELKEKGYKKTQAWDTTRGYHIFDLGKFTPEFVKNLIMDICCEKQIPMSFPIKEENGKKWYAKDGVWEAVPPNFSPPPVPKPNIDTSIYDIRRIRRVAYALHSKTGRPMVRII